MCDVATAITSIGDQITDLMRKWHAEVMSQPVNKIAFGTYARECTACGHSDLAIEAAYDAEFKELVVSYGDYFQIRWGVTVEQVGAYMLAAQEEAAPHLKVLVDAYNDYIAPIDLGRG